MPAWGTSTWTASRSGERSSSVPGDGVTRGVNGASPAGGAEGSGATAGCAVLKTAATTSPRGASGCPGPRR